MVDKEEISITPEKKEQEFQTPDISPEEKDLTTLKTIVDVNTLKTEVKETRSTLQTTYELIKDTTLYTSLLNIWKNDAEIKEFSDGINTIVTKFLNQELEWFSDDIKKSMSIGIQFTMMETLIKQWADWSTEFFSAFSSVKSQDAGKAFKSLYKAFWKLWSANEFYVLANKIQNLTWYLSDKKNIITESKNIPELMNPYIFKELLKQDVRSDQKKIDKLDINKILTLYSDKIVDVNENNDKLTAIANDPAMKNVITKESIKAIQKSLISADILLDHRWTLSSKATELIDKIASFLDIDIPFLWNLGELVGIDFPADILWERKDAWVMNFVLWVLGFRWWLKGLHRKYIQEKLDDLDIDTTFISTAYTSFQKNTNTTITHDLDSGTWKTCALSGHDATQEIAMKAKIPADYSGLKKSIVDNLSTAILNPVMVAKFAPHAITLENNKNVVDISKITDKEVFVDEYLKYIIPVLADPAKKFITSDKVDKDAFALAAIGGLVGDKYFIEWISIWLLSVADYKKTTTETLWDTPIELSSTETLWYTPIELWSTGLTRCSLSQEEYQKFIQKVVIISKNLWMNPEHLMKVMAFETVGTLSPSIQNPKSSATWLIQFMGETAINYWTNVNILKTMTALDQLDYVEKYFLKHKNQLKTLEDVYLAVFSPAFIGKSLDYVGYSIWTAAYAQNKWFDVNKDGKMTVEEITTIVRNSTQKFNFFTTEKIQIENIASIPIQAKTLDDVVLLGDSHAGWISAMWGFKGQTLYYNGYDSWQLLTQIKLEKEKIQKKKSLVLFTWANDIWKWLIDTLKNNLALIQAEIAPVQLVLSTLHYSKTKTLLTDAKVDQANKIITDFARENSLPVIDTNKELTLADTEYQVDGIHLTTVGYTKIAENINHHILLSDHTTTVG